MRFDMEQLPREERRAAAVRLSIKGINYFDTAPGYCSGKSEDIFGIAFAQMARQTRTVRGHQQGHARDRSTTAEKPPMPRCARSLEKMKLDRLDFFYVWCIRKMDLLPTWP